MGGLQSCLNSRWRAILFGSTSAASTPPMITEGAGKKEYSWDKRRKETDLSKFTIENVAAGEVGRMPGDIAGSLQKMLQCRLCFMNHFGIWVGHECTYVTKNNPSPSFSA